MRLPLSAGLCGSSKTLGKRENTKDRSHCRRYGLGDYWLKSDFSATVGFGQVFGFFGQHLSRQMTVEGQDRLERPFPRRRQKKTARFWDRAVLTP
jgi:ribosomal protein L37E